MSSFLFVYLYFVGPRKLHEKITRIMSEILISIAIRVQTAIEEAVTKEEKRKLKRGFQPSFGKNLVRLIVYFWE